MKCILISLCSSKNIFVENNYYRRKIYSYWKLCEPKGILSVEKKMLKTQVGKVESTNTNEELTLAHFRNGTIFWHADELILIRTSRLSQGKTKGMVFYLRIASQLLNRQAKSLRKKQKVEFQTIQTSRFLDRQADSLNGYREMIFLDRQMSRLLRQKSQHFQKI